MRIVFFAFLLLAPLLATAGQADVFRGAYEIQQPASDPKEYMLVDSDRLEALWARRFEGPMPPDFESLRQELTVLVYFTSTKFMLLTLESGAIFTPGYMGLMGGNGDRFEMRARGDGTFDAAYLKGSALHRFHLAAPVEWPVNPGSLRASELR